MKRSEKEQLVDELTTKIKGAKALYYTDFSGLSVKRMTELRRRFTRAGVEYVVIKNTLAGRAVTGAGLDATRLKGPTGVVIGKDPVAAAKVLSDFARENDQKPGVKGGMLDGKSIDAAQVKKLASLPSREQMLAELGAGFQAPLASFVGALNGLLYTFAGALEGLRSQREGAQ
jgi:large subunit ribosomal protein L10